MLSYIMKTGVIVGLAIASTGFAQQSENWANDAIWAKPLSNPVYNDLAMIKRELNLAYVYQTLPSHISSSIGDLALDGDMHAVAVQLELPLGCSNFSFVANKSGYASFNPEKGALSKDSGFIDLAGGLKWAFMNCQNYTIAARATVEIPVGDEDVFQGNGDGNISPALLATYLTDNHCLNGVIGAIIPFDNGEESTMGYLSLSYAYRVTNWFAPHVELNWFRVLDEGEGDANFDNDQLNQTLPNVLTFEGGDLINLGAAQSEKDPDFVSLALGARFQVAERISIGAAYEIPLSTKDKGLMDERLTAHLTFTF